MQGFILQFNQKAKKSLFFLFKQDIKEINKIIRKESLGESSEATTEWRVSDESPVRVCDMLAGPQATLNVQSRARQHRLKKSHLIKNRPIDGFNVDAVH